MTDYIKIPWFEQLRRLAAQAKRMGLLTLAAALRALAERHEVTK